MHEHRCQLQCRSHGGIITPGICTCTGKYDTRISATAVFHRRDKTQPDEHQPHALKGMMPLGKCCLIGLQLALTGPSPFLQVCLHASLLSLLFAIRNSTDAFDRDGQRKSACSLHHLVEQLSRSPLLIFAANTVAHGWGLPELRGDSIRERG